MKRPALFLIFLGLFILVWGASPCTAAQTGYWKLVEIKTGTAKNHKAKCKEDQVRIEQGEFGFKRIYHKGVCKRRKKLTFAATASYAPPPATLHPQKTVTLEALAERSANLGLFLEFGVALSIDSINTPCGKVKNGRELGRAEVFSRKHPGIDSMKLKYRAPHGAKGASFALRYCPVGSPRFRQPGVRYLYKWQSGAPVASSAGPEISQTKESETATLEQDPEADYPKDRRINTNRQMTLLSSIGPVWYSQNKGKHFLTTHSGSKVELKVGDIVITPPYKEIKAYLQTEDISLFVIKPSTSLELIPRGIRLNSGELLFDLAAKDKDIKVVTPATDCSFSEAAGSISISDDWNTTVRITRAKAFVSDPQGEGRVILNAGQSTTIQPGGKPSRPQAFSGYIQPIIQEKPGAKAEKEKKAKDKKAAVKKPEMSKDKKKPKKARTKTKAEKPRKPKKPEAEKAEKKKPEPKTAQADPAKPAIVEPAQGKAVKQDNKKAEKPKSAAKKPKKNRAKAKSAQPRQTALKKQPAVKAKTARAEQAKTKGAKPAKVKPVAAKPAKAIPAKAIPAKPRPAEPKPAKTVRAEVKRAKPKQPEPKIQKPKPAKTRETKPATPSPVVSSGQVEKWFQQGILAVRQGKFNSATKLLGKAIESGQLSGQKLANAFYQRGWAHGKLGKMGLALRDVESAIKHQSDNSIYHHMRAWWLMKFQRYQEAVQECGIALKLNPKNPFAYHTLSRTHQEMGQCAKALEYAHKSLSLRPQDRNLANHLARLKKEGCGAVDISGVWHNAKSGEAWTFSPKGGNRYAAVEKGNSNAQGEAEASGNLVKLVFTYKIKGRSYKGYYSLTVDKAKGIARGTWKTTLPARGEVTLRFLPPGAKKPAPKALETKPKPKAVSKLKPRELKKAQGESVSTVKPVRLAKLITKNKPAQAAGKQLKSKDKPKEAAKAKPKSKVKKAAKAAAKTKVKKGPAPKAPKTVKAAAKSTKKPENEVMAKPKPKAVAKAKSKTTPKPKAKKMPEPELVLEPEAKVVKRPRYEGVWTRSVEGTVVDIIKIKRSGPYYKASFHLRLDKKPYATSQGLLKSGVLLMNMRGKKGNKLIRIKAVAKGDRMDYRTFNADGSPRTSGKYERISVMGAGG
jgi:tetratricopeptide (TPR) repeat protein